VKIISFQYFSREFGTLLCSLQTTLDKVKICLNFDLAKEQTIQFVWKFKCFCFLTARNLNLIFSIQNQEMSSGHLHCHCTRFCIWIQHSEISRIRGLEFFNFFYGFSFWKQNKYLKKYQIKKFLQKSSFVIVNNFNYQNFCGDQSPLAVKQKNI